MKGVVLAAGFGQRLLPITETVPKPLLPVGNLPLVGYALKLLQFHNITDVMMNLHYLPKAMQAALGDGHAYGINLGYSLEEEILGTGGAIKRMLSFLDTTFVLLNSDTVIDVDLHSIISEHKARGALATMVLRDAPGDPESNKIEVDGDGRIVRILGTPDVAIPTRRFMFTGVHIIEPRFLEYIPPDVHTCIVRYGYAKALSNNEPLFGAVINGYFSDAGTPARYLRANMDALDQKMHLRHADPLGGFALAAKRDVADVVRMGSDVDLGSGVRPAPPVLLGDGARIGDNTVVGPYTIVGARANIGKDCSVRESIILEGAKVDAGARIEKMLIGKKSSLSLA